MRVIAALFLTCGFLGIANCSEGLDADVLKKVKAATVFIRVETENAVIQGSGFFCDGHVIVTNAHVLGVKDPPHRPPKKITIVLNSGTGKAVEAAAELVTFDAEADLAFIKTTQDLKQIPESLTLSSAKQVSETTPVFIFGYPFGDILAGLQDTPAVTVGTATVSSLRLDQSGMLDKIQINGDLNPGNSGGPIVLKTGEVVAVSVATVRGTQIGIAIPCDKVRNDFNPRVKDVSLSHERRAGTKYRFHIKVTVSDPLAKIDEMAFYGWSCEQDSKRPINPETKQAEFGAFGDSPRRKFELKRDTDGTWQCDVKDESIPAIKEYWYQIGYKGTEFPRERMSEATKSNLPDEAALDDSPAALPAAQPTPALQTVVSPVLLPGAETDEENGKKYTLVKTKAEKLNIPKGLTQLISSPDGKLAYGIFEDSPTIKVFEPPSFKEVDEIPVPHTPLSIWCDESRLVAACYESRVITILDAVKRTPVKAVQIKDPSYHPFSIVGLAPDGELMTLWRQDYENKAISLYKVDKSGNAEHVLGGDFTEKVTWCMMTNGPPGIITVEDSGLHLVGMDFRGDEIAGKLFGKGESLNSHGFGKISLLDDQRRILLPRYKVADSGKDWTYVTNTELNRTLFEFPGSAIAEYPGLNVFISIVSPDGMRDREILYINRSSGRICRKIRVEGFYEGISLKNAVFIPGHEILVCHTKGESPVMIRCGPVKDARIAPGLTLHNDPPTLARVGERISFTPEFSTIGATQVTFKLKRPLEGMKIDPEKGVLTWIPTEVYIGKYEVAIVADVDGQDVPVVAWTLEIEK